jgi:hypothetical protein
MRLPVIPAALVAAALACAAAAQDRADSAKPKPKPEERKLSEQDERAALDFAQEHHADLHALLLRLRQGRKGQYLTAVRQIHQTRERLERLRERTPDRYEASLKQWRIDSRLRLLVARMTMSDDPALNEELRELLAERTRLRLELLRLDRERLKSRLEKVNDQIIDLEADPAAVAEKDLAAIRRSLGIPASTNPQSAPDSPKNSKTPRKKQPATTGP